MRKLTCSLAILLVVAACASPGATSDPRDNIRKGVIAFHDGLYVPTMQELGARYDRGDKWVVSNRLRIQQLSEQYVLLKDEIDATLRMWDFVTSPAAANAKMQTALMLVGELQKISAGGK